MDRCLYDYTTFYNIATLLRLESCCKKEKMLQVILLYECRKILPIQKCKKPTGEI